MKKKELIERLASYADNAEVKFSGIEEDMPVKDVTPDAAPSEDGTTVVPVVLLHV